MNVMAKQHNRTTAEWRAEATAHHMAPFTNYSGLAGEGGPRVVTSAEGVWLHDSDGHKILDGMAGLWCVNIGYGRKELAEAAYQQMLELPYYNSFFKTTTPPTIALAERLAEITPAGLNHVFFGSSGSESNDTVVRLVRTFWNMMGQPQKKTIISRRWAYHGSTVAGASLCGMTHMHRQADLPIPGIVHIMPPYSFDYAHPGESADAFGERAARALEDRIIELGADSVAAFIAEPVQGAGGVIIPPDTYFPKVQEICRKYDVLFVVDEVICGFGRTGNWFGSETYDLSPDLMTFAKGVTSGYLPLSGVMVGDRIYNGMVASEKEFFHGYTYSGHPAAAAVALMNIDLLERDGIVDQVRDDTAPYFQQCLHQAFDDHPLVGEVRGVGLLACMELVEDKATGRHFQKVGEVGSLCRDHCFANNLVMRAVRDGMVLSPPLIITRAEIDELVTRAKAAFDATARDLGRM